MGACVSKCYSSDPFIHLDSDQLQDKLVVSETSPPLPPTSSVSSSSAAASHSAFSSSSPSSSSSSSFAAPSVESSSKKPLPSTTEINPIVAESQSDQKCAPPAPRATKQQLFARTSTAPASAKRGRSCSPAAIAERRSFAGSTRGGAASPSRVPRSRSLVSRKESVRSGASCGRALSMSRGRGMVLLNQTDRRVQKVSNSIVGQSVAVEELDNPLISMDCFIFI